MGRLLVDSPLVVGDLGVRGEGYPCQTTPQLPGGIKAWSYRVPTGNKLSLRAIYLSCQNGTINGTAQAASFNAGIAKLRVGADDKLEMRVTARVVQDFVSSGCECQAGWICQAQLFDLHDGVIFGVGETFSLAFTPAAANSGAMIKATAFCTTAAGPMILHGTLRWIATTANQTILTFTPTEATTLKSITFNVIACGSGVLMGGRLELNGAPIAEFGPMGMDQATPNFALWHLPLQGVELQQGDLLEVFVHPMADLNHVITVSLAGNLTPYATGGGSGISRSRVIARC